MHAVANSHGLNYLLHFTCQVSESGSAVGSLITVGTKARDAINLTYREIQQTLAIAATAALAPI